MPPTRREYANPSIVTGKVYNAKQITQIKALIAMAIKVVTRGDEMRIMVGYE